jgi:hypothetical protein
MKISSRTRKSLDQAMVIIALIVSAIGAYMFVRHYAKLSGQVYKQGQAMYVLEKENAELRRKKDVEIMRNDLMQVQLHLDPRRAGEIDLIPLRLTTSAGDTTLGCAMVVSDGKQRLLRTDGATLGVVVRGPEISPN